MCEACKDFPEQDAFVCLRIICVFQKLILLSTFFQKLHWFNVFMDKYDGIIHYDNRTADEFIHLVKSHRA